MPNQSNTSNPRSGSWWTIVIIVVVLALLGIWMLKRYQAREEARLSQPSSQPTVPVQTDSK